MKILAPIRQRSTDWVLQFINIVFLLLLYFLVNGSIVEQRPRGIELPMSPEPQAGSPPRQALYIDALGRMNFGGRDVSADDVAAALAGRGASPPLTVVADRRLPATALIETLDGLKQRGQFSFAIVTEADISR